MNLASNNMPRFNPQSKFFGVKYHWLRSKLNDLDYKIKPMSMYTSLQKPAIFTKGIGRNDFQNKRKPLMEW